VKARSRISSTRRLRRVGRNTRTRWGKEVAESTSYFKEALNEILADGRQIF